MGNHSLESNSLGNSNIAIGRAALLQNTLSSFNIAIGDSTLFRNAKPGTPGSSGYSNVAIGTKALYNNVTGFRNVAIGHEAGKDNNTGIENVFVGADAGGESNGSGNIFIGNNAGYFETGSNKLIIDNDAGGLPFIYGEMDNQILNVNGNVVVEDTLAGRTLMVSDNGSPALIFERLAPNYLSWKLSMESGGLKFYRRLENGFFEQNALVSDEGHMFIKGQINVNSNVTVNNTSGFGSFMFNNGFGLQSYQLRSNSAGFTIKSSSDRLTMTNNQETFLFDEVTIENDLIISNDFESKILFERTNTGAHDWEVLAKSGDLFFRGGADGSGADLFNKVVMRNNGDLEVCGKLFAASATVTAFSCTSDLRYKKNISPLSNALSSIIVLQGVTYDWKKDEFPDMPFTAENQIGFIAQEVEEIFPSMVFTDDEGYKSVDYSRLTPVLTEAIKEQQIKIETLENLLSQLTERIEQIESRERQN